MKTKRKTASSFGEFAENAWSFSRDTALRWCERQFFYSVYGKWNGWSTLDPTVPERQIYLLDKLLTVAQLRGRLFHNALERFLIPVLKGPQKGQLSGSGFVELEGEMYAWAEREAERVRTQQLQAFLRDPKANPMLARAYHRDDPDSIWEETEDMLADLSRAFAALGAHPILSELAQCRPEHVITAEEFGQVELPPDRADGHRAKMSAKVDLAIRVPPDFDRIKIIDWKLGRTAGAEEQVIGYAVFLLSKRMLQWTKVADRLQGHVVALGPGGQDLLFDISEDRLLAAAGRIRNGARVMEEYLVDPRTRKPLPLEAFSRVPESERPQKCRYCSFAAKCALDDELQSIRNAREDIALPPLHSAQAGEVTS